jgi:hypothetical protein
LNRKNRPAKPGGFILSKLNQACDHQSIRAQRLIDVRFEARQTLSSGMLRLAVCLAGAVPWY